MGEVISSLPNVSANSAAVSSSTSPVPSQSGHDDHPRRRFVEALVLHQLAVFDPDVGAVGSPAFGLRDRARHPVLFQDADLAFRRVVTEEAVQGLLPFLPSYVSSHSVSPTKSSR